MGDSSFISSFAASAQVAVSSLQPLFDSNVSCLDFFLLELVTVASILNILVLLYGQFYIYVKTVNSAVLFTVVHITACFFFFSS